MRLLFDLGAGTSGLTLNYNNNLQATAAMDAYAAGLIGQDSGLRWWAIQSSMEVLDTVDEDGFTNEIFRYNKEKAEYYSHETMIYLIATARLAEKAGNYSLWDYVGKGEVTRRDPTLLRIGRLLDLDLGNSQRYSARTGKAQIAYSGAIAVDGVRYPSGYLTWWVPAFLDQYSGSFPRLRIAEPAYQQTNMRHYNPGVGGW
jgi:hypothetical protein